MLRRVWSWTCAFQKRVPANKTLIELIKRFASNFFYFQNFLLRPENESKNVSEILGFFVSFKNSFPGKSRHLHFFFLFNFLFWKKKKKLRKTERFGKVRQKISADKERQRTEWIILGRKKSPLGKWRWLRNQLKTILGYFIEETNCKLSKAWSISKPEMSCSMVRKG